MNEVWVAMNGNTSLTPVTFGLAQLAPSKADGGPRARLSLLSTLAAAGSRILPED